MAGLAFLAASRSLNFISIARLRSRVHVMSRRANITRMKALIGSCLIAFAALAASQVPAAADCQCRANGREFQQGQLACLKLPNGTQLARCGMELNNSSWKKVQDGCPSAATASGSWISAALDTLGDHSHPPGTGEARHHGKAAIE